VLLLRDVFDYSVRDTAAALDMHEPAVKTTLHRARRAMAAYDRARTVPTRALQERTRAALERFLAGLAAHDRDAVEALLAEDVRSVHDAGGEGHAARKPILGRARVARFFDNVAARAVEPLAAAFRTLNGLPALVVTGAGGTPVRFVLRADVDGAGRLRTVHVILARRKLTAVT
jgi:RNA polymerase sigma-70 factor (ECF subfamily)